MTKKLLPTDRRLTFLTVTGLIIIIGLFLILSFLLISFQSGGLELGPEEKTLVLTNRFLKTNPSLSVEEAEELATKAVGLEGKPGFQSLLPDVAIEDIVFSPDTKRFKAGETVTLQVTIKNKGRGIARSTRTDGKIPVLIQANGLENGMCIIEPCKTGKSNRKTTIFWVGPLKPSEETNIQTTFIPLIMEETENGLVEANLLLKDEQRTLYKDLSLKNNRLEKKITITERETSDADLLFTDIKLIGERTINNKIDLTATIRNVGIERPKLKREIKETGKYDPKLIEKLAALQNVPITFTIIPQSCAEDVNSANCKDLISIYGTKIFRTVTSSIPLLSPGEEAIIVKEITFLIPGSYRIIPGFTLESESGYFKAVEEVEDEEEITTDVTITETRPIITKAILSPTGIDLSIGKHVLGGTILTILKEGQVSIFKQFEGRLGKNDLINGKTTIDKINIAYENGEVKLDNGVITSNSEITTRSTRYVGTVEDFPIEIFYENNNFKAKIGGQTVTLNYDKDSIFSSETILNGIRYFIGFDITAEEITIFKT